MQLSKSRLSASGMETPAAIQAEELNAKCQCSHAGNQLAVKGMLQRRAAGIPQEMPLLPPWALSMWLWTAFSCSGNFLLPQNAPQKLGTQGWRGDSAMGLSLPSPWCLSHS